nr:MAG TPA: hypothetical protein [Caudoviricetes sp.]
MPAGNAQPQNGPPRPLFIAIREGRYHESLHSANADT